MGHNGTAASEGKQVGVKCWHMGLNVVEKEGLQQMRSVNLHVNLFKEGVDGELVLGDAVLDKAGSQFAQIVEAESINSFLTESEAREWAEAILGFVNVVYKHDSISEVSIGNNHLNQILLGEC